MERAGEDEPEQALAGLVDRHGWAATVLVVAPAVLAAETLAATWLRNAGEGPARPHALALVAVLALALAATVLRGVRGSRPLGAAPALLALVPLILLAPATLPVDRLAAIPAAAVIGLALALLVRALRDPRPDARLRLAEATGWCAAGVLLLSWALAAA